MKPRATLRLGGTCPECNVLSIGRQCHDDANSPDFDYRRDLPKARHPVGQDSRKLQPPSSNSQGNLNPQ